MHLNRRRAMAKAAMEGMSLVELMVGVAVSLFIVAAAAMLASAQLSDNRRLLLETQVQQDLRATADIVSRELRRSSYWDQAWNGVPTPSGSAVAPNPYVAIAVTSANASVVYYRYRRPSGFETFGFKLNSDGTVVACQLANTSGDCNSGWQELSDPNTVRITEFLISETRPANSANDDAQILPCPYACANGTAACWPRVTVREFTLAMTGVSRTDASVIRKLRSSVRVRNDRVDVSNEAPTGQSCPAG